MHELRRDKRLLVIGEPDFKSPFLIGKCFEREGCCYARHPLFVFSHYKRQNSDATLHVRDILGRFGSLKVFSHFSPMLS